MLGLFNDMDFEKGKAKGRYAYRNLPECINAADNT